MHQPTARLNEPEYNFRFSVVDQTRIGQALGIPANDHRLNLHAKFDGHISETAALRLAAVIGQNPPDELIRHWLFRPLMLRNFDDKVKK